MNAGRAIAGDERWEDLRGERLYLSHFATCPFARRHARGRR